MEKVPSFRILMSSVVLATFALSRIAQSAKMSVDVPTHVPSKLEDIPVILPDSWPTVDPTYVPENISAEVKEGGSEEVIKRLKGRTGYLMPNRKPNDFHNHDRRHSGFATKNYCEYEGRYVRRGAQKYIPETDKVVVCRSVNPLWISVYVCNVLLNTPEKYKDMTVRLTSNCVKLCETKPGMKTKPPADFPEWQQRMHNASQRLKTETFTTSSNRLHRNLKPLSTTETLPKGRKKATTRTKTTLWDGEWNPEWNDLKFQPVTLRREEAALRAAGLWFTTADLTVGTSSGEMNDEEDTLETPQGAARRMPYPQRTTLPTMVDDELGEASPFFVKPKTTKSLGIKLIDSESETEASIPESALAEGSEGDGDHMSLLGEDGAVNVDEPADEPWEEPQEMDDDKDDPYE